MSRPRFLLCRLFINRAAMGRARFLLFNRFITGLPVGQTQSESGLHFIVFYFFFSVSGKGLSVTPLLSSVFVHRVFSEYFVRFEGAGVIRRFPW